MRITIKALLKKKYNDRAKRRVAAIKAAEVEYPTAQRGTLESVAAQGVASPQQNGESAGEGSLGNDKTMEPVEVQAQNTPMLNEDSKRDVPAESIEHDNPIAVVSLSPSVKHSSRKCLYCGRPIEVAENPRFRRTRSARYKNMISSATLVLLVLQRAWTLIIILDKSNDPLLMA